MKFIPCSASNLISMPRRNEAGMTMIEVLITFFVLAVGLLGLIGLQARSQRADLESYQRGQALVLIQDIIDRMNANRIDAKNQAYVTSGVGGGGSLSDCSGLTGAAFDLCDWGNELIGAAEVAGGGSCTTTNGSNCIGAMRGARGCISYDAGSELTDSTGAAIAGTGVQTITVAWQGLKSTGVTATLPANISCGQNLYPSEAERRVAYTTLRMGSLTAQ
jgi:type IV pilus assembly protein PilV